MNVARSAAPPSLLRNRSRPSRSYFGTPSDARKAQESPAADDGTIFDKILSGEIPADVVYENEVCMAFRDVAPQAPEHVLVIPRTRIRSLSATTQADALLLGQLLSAANHVAVEKLGLGESGFRIVINDGADGCQSVFHLHIHILGGRQLTWPPG